MEKKNKQKLLHYLCVVNLADDGWKLFLVFAVGVFVGWLISRQTTLRETTAAGKGFTRLTDFTRDEQGRVISIVERYVPVEELG